MPNIADYLNRRDLETIGRFTATWAVFEQELFSKKVWKCGKSEVLFLRTKLLI